MKQYDLIVVGGGLTGVAAAVSAAREGLLVLLVEKSGALGGAMTNNLIYPFMKYWTMDPETGERVDLSAGIFSELRALQKKYCGTDGNAHFNPEYYKFLLDEMVTEAGVEVLFHGMVFGVEKEADSLTAIRVAIEAMKRIIAQDKEQLKKAGLFTRTDLLSYANLSG